MRRVLHQDVVALARVLYARPKAHRPRAALTYLTLASIADRYRRKNGRAHPVFGDGTLSDCISGVEKPEEPPLSNKEYCACLALIFGSLAR